MDIFQEIGNKQRAKDTLAAVMYLFAAANFKPEADWFALHENTGTVSFQDTYTFTVLFGKLLMEGPCPKCSMNDWSIPIKTLADVRSLTENFRVGKDHRCMDV